MDLRRHLQCSCAIIPFANFADKRCGRRFTETVREIDTGAVNAWIQSTKHAQSDGTKSTPTYEERSEANGSGQGLGEQSQSGQFRRQVGRINQGEDDENQSRDHCRGGCNFSNADTIRSQNQGGRFALLCFKTGKHTILLEQSEMSKDAGVSSDRDMFCRLRSEYQKKRWQYWIRLIQLSHMEFQQVSVVDLFFDIAR